jgi:hypothetical protein
MRRRNSPTSPMIWVSCVLHSISEVNCNRSRDSADEKGKPGPVSSSLERTKELVQLTTNALCLARSPQNSVVSYIAQSNSRMKQFELNHPQYEINTQDLEKLGFILYKQMNTSFAAYCQPIDVRANLQRQ